MSLTWNFDKASMRTGQPPTLHRVHCHYTTLWNMGAVLRLVLRKEMNFSSSFGYQYAAGGTMEARESPWNGVR
jgi:hypothetical protein